MSQQAKLPKIKRIELPAKNLRPYPGAVAVGQLPDGTPIWYGEVPASNPFFRDHNDPRDNGHSRVQLMDPADPTKERWRRNRNGEPITRMTKARRNKRLVKYVMVDDANAGAGPRPVPDNAMEMTEAQKLEASMPEFQRQVMLAARKQGLTAADIANALAKLAGVDTDDDEAQRAHFPENLDTPLPEATHALVDEPGMVDAVDEFGNPITLPPEMKKDPKPKAKAKAR